MSSVGGSPMEATLSTPPMRGVSCAWATDTDRTRTVTRATRLFIAGILRGKKVARMIPSAVVLNVLVTMPFGEARLDRLRAVSPDLRVSAGRAALAALRADGIARRRAGGDRLRQHRPGAGAHGDDRAGHARARVQARPVTSRRRRLPAARHRGSGGRAA